MEDIYIKYLREYYEVHGTINDISTLSSVEYENQVLNIGNFLGNVRKRYKEHLAGKREFSNQVLNRFSALNEMEFEWNPRAAKSKNIKENVLAIEIDELNKIDIELFKKETQEYNKVVNVFDSAKTYEELNIMLLDIFNKMGYNKPWQGSFDEHMSNKSGTLRFE